jgi:hypothetical protein
MKCNERTKRREVGGANRHPGPSIDRCVCTTLDIGPHMSIGFPVLIRPTADEDYVVFVHFLGPGDWGGGTWCSLIHLSSVVVRGGSSRCRHNEAKKEEMYLSIIEQRG